MYRSFVDKKFQQLKEDALSACLRTNEYCDVAKPDIGTGYGPNPVGSNPIYNHAKNAFNLFVSVNCK